MTDAVNVRLAGLVLHPMPACPLPGARWVGNPPEVIHRVTKGCMQEAGMNEKSNLSTRLRRPLAGGRYLQVTVRLRPGGTRLVHIVHELRRMVSRHDNPCYPPVSVDAHSCSTAGFLSWRAGAHWREVRPGAAPYRATFCL